MNFLKKLGEYKIFVRFVKILSKLKKINNKSGICWILQRIQKKKSKKKNPLMDPLNYIPN